MRVRVYVDGFNLYYGGKGHAAQLPSPPPWKWIDVRALAELVVARRWTGQSARIEHVTYCTARISSPTAAQQRQDAYLEALRRSGSVDLIEEGLFVERYAELPLATRGKDNRPVLVRKAGRMQFVGVSRREEKGSDVNVATHLVVDALDGKMDAAVVISNDSDLALAIRLVRDRMPVGTINPQPTRAGVANALRPPKLAGSGHWFDQLAFADFTASQLPDPCRGVPRPKGW